MNRRSGYPVARWKYRVGWLVMLAVLAVFAAACTGPTSNPPPPPKPSPTPAAVVRDYWPTAGWRTAAPEKYGLDPGKLAAIEQHVAAAYPHVRSVLIVRHGYLVYERYWHGLDQTSGHDVQSVTTSVVGALVGIALAEGKIKSLDQTVGELLASHLPQDADLRTATVTVRQLLTMTSGLAGDAEAPNGDPRIEEAMLASPDWIRHILSRQLVADPGTRFAYSNASAHLLSAIAADVSGESTLAYARDKLFGPLGIRADNAFEPMLKTNIDPPTVQAYEQATAAWPVDPQGYNYGAAGLRLPARDLAKLGYLYLNGGRWDGQQVVPAEYVAAGTSAGGSSPNLSRGYGWLWRVGTEGGRTFFAHGQAGQYIYVVPELDLVTVVTSDPHPGGLDPKVLISQTIVGATTG